jgi:hypothetical protein
MKTLTFCTYVFNFRRSTTYLVLAQSLGPLPMGPPKPPPPPAPSAPVRFVPSAFAMCSGLDARGDGQFLPVRGLTSRGRDGDDRMGGARMLLLMLLLSTSFVTLLAEQELGATLRLLCFWRTRAIPARARREHTLRVGGRAGKCLSGRAWPVGLAERRNRLALACPADDVQRRNCVHRMRAR